MRSHLKSTVLSTLKIRGDIFLLLPVPKILHHSLLDFFIIFSTKLVAEINARKQRHASFLFLSAIDWLAEDHPTTHLLRIVMWMSYLFLSLTNFPTLPIHCCYSKGNALCASSAGSCRFTQTDSTRNQES